MLARQVNPGKVQEFMAAYEKATSRPHGYLLDLKATTDDQQRLKTNALPGEVCKFMQKQPYLQPPVLNEKSMLCSDQVNRIFTVKNKMENRHLPVKTSPPSEPVLSTSDERAEITPPCSTCHS